MKQPIADKKKLKPFGSVNDGVINLPYFKVN